MSLLSSWPVKVYGPNLTVEILLIPNSIKISAQVINHFSKIWQNKKIIKFMLTSFRYYGIVGLLMYMTLHIYSYLYIRIGLNDSRKDKVKNTII
jgi:hypothetical protein